MAVSPHRQARDDSKKETIRLWQRAIATAVSERHLEEAPSKANIRLPILLSDYCKACRIWLKEYHDYMPSSLRAGVHLFKHVTTKAKIKPPLDGPAVQKLRDDTLLYCNSHVLPKYCALVPGELPTGKTIDEILDELVAMLWEDEEQVRLQAQRKRKQKRPAPRLRPRWPKLRRTKRPACLCEHQWMPKKKARKNGSKRRAT